ncbi:PA2169 family four-helix-bundle protein [Mucilaginibacter sp. HC2]|uniref:ferritin-like domain-containing protein n=1 Tax=Mucilaginibacter inviolabilis TaxID=2714892 RepID=UPI0014082F4F|nr:PA2169 family four-helix-bundle protein [Mucilaginibacter inviolabilis]NHA02703.1 PA2169 family four-helix-bundle protein [Mucilaginibacter inviolabilis]
MEITAKSTEVLNDLIEINNDRVAGFEKAIADIKDENIDLKELFQEYSAQSRRFSQELTQVVANEGGEAETGTSASGSLHRAWIDVKSIFGASDRAGILNEAERGEDAIKKAYQQALSESGLSPEAQSKVSEQAGDINAAHDRIKALRDAAK